MGGWTGRGLLALGGGGSDWVCLYCGLAVLGKEALKDGVALGRRGYKAQQPAGPSPWCPSVDLLSAFRSAMTGQRPNPQEVLARPLGAGQAAETALESSTSIILVRPFSGPVRLSCSNARASAAQLSEAGPGAQEHFPTWSCRETQQAISLAFRATSEGATHLPLRAPRVQDQPFGFPPLGVCRGCWFYSRLWVTRVHSPQKKWSYSVNTPAREGESTGWTWAPSLHGELTHFCSFPRDQHNRDEHLQEATHLQAEG